jgi:hypothetical protein
MQPIAGIHIGSSMDRRRFDEELYHEDWSGPLEGSPGGRVRPCLSPGLQPFRPHAPAGILLEEGPALLAEFCDEYTSPEQAAKRKERLARRGAGRAARLAKQRENIIQAIKG